MKNRAGFARRSAPLAAVAVLASGMLVTTAGPVAAHERREVGEYIFVVGFGTEPAYALEPNSVQLTLSDRNEEPVVDLGETLSVEVAFGDQSIDLGTLEPRFVVDVFGTPGDYRANFVPSRPGQYSFRFSGEIKGQAVDETFTSGPETFNDVEDPVAQMFPVRDPTAGQVAERLDREVARLSEGGGDTLARFLGIVAIVLAAGAVIGAVLAGRRRL